MYKREREGTKNYKKQTENSKIAIHTHLSIITLNIKGIMRLSKDKGWLNVY